jgi:hypothetical protein
MRPSLKDRKYFFLSIGEGPIKKKSNQKIEKYKKPKIANQIIHSYQLINRGLRPRAFEL